MTNDRDSRLMIAQRIAEAENRVTLLRARVDRLQSEGSDALQAIEMLRIASRNLSNLYVQQSMMRRAVWSSQFACPPRCLAWRAPAVQR
jgi:hypothetical protein